MISISKIINIIALTNMVFQIGILSAVIVSTDCSGIDIARISIIVFDILESIIVILSLISGFWLSAIFHFILILGTSAYHLYIRNKYKEKEINE